MTRLVFTLALLISLSSLLSCGRAQTSTPDTVWEGLRSATIYVRVSETHTTESSVELRWKPAWISDSQRERLYWYGPTGNLLTRVEIEPNQTSGNISLPIARGTGDYRLVIPGYSFRKYNVRVPGRYKTVIEPEKLHFSMELREGHSFWTGPLRKAVLKLKSHRDSTAISVRRNEETIATVAHTAGRQYRNHKSMQFDAAGAQVKLSIVDGGKFSFWIDDGPNVFSQTRNDWFEPEWKDGVVTFDIFDEMIGNTTKIGMYTEFAPYSSKLKGLLSDIRPSIVHSYIFEDVMDKHAARDDANNRALFNLGIDETYGLLSRTTRDSVPSSTSGSADFLDKYIRARHRKNLPLHTIAFVDEPNLRYRSYEAYEAYHLALARIVRQINSVFGTETKIAAPESSRMVNGPTNKPRRFQSGLSWTEKLLSRNWNSVDVISWHMWQYRSLEALDQFPETIRDVAQVNEQLAAKFGETPKDLSISQTNLGSGPNTSTYQQNTHYASLWWASVVTQSIATGKLESLIWFKAVDEGPYGKGLLMKQNGHLKRKPIADAMIFINQSVLPQTLRASSSSHEVDVTATKSSSGEVSILCVNKSRRNYSIFLNASDFDVSTLEVFRSDNSVERTKLSNLQKTGKAAIKLRAQSICRFTSK